jgi:hypothetical protein
MQGLRGAGNASDGGAGDDSDRGAGDAMLLDWLKD